MNNGTNIIDEILEIEKKSSNVKGIGFDYNYISK